MDIRKIIENKYDEINTKKNSFSSAYIDSVIFENSYDFEYDIINESIGDTLVNIKNRVVESIKKLWKSIKDFFTKLRYNIGIMFTRTDTLIKNVSFDIIALFKIHANKMSASMCSYKYDPNKFSFFVETILNQSRDAILNWEVKSFEDEAVDEILNKRFLGRKVEQITLSDPKGNVNLENVKLLARKCIIKDPEVKVRKVSDIMDWETFGYALHGKDDIKNIKKGIKHTDSIFKELIQQIESERVDYDDDGSTESKKIKNGFDAKLKCSNAMCKIITTFMKTYLGELKKLVRFSRSLVKKLARKVDPTIFN